MTTILLLLASVAGAATTNVPGVKTRNEGSNIGQALTLDCVGTGIDCSYSGGVTTLSVGSGGTVGVSSSCATGEYWDDFNATNGVVNGGTCLALPAGSEGNTYTSSKTFTRDVWIKGSLIVDSSATFKSSATFVGNVGISTGSGITAGASASTMTPCGSLFFISSQTVTGSTTTAGTALTTFSTYTLLANALKVGDALNVRCVFYQTTAPGTPVAGVYVDSVARGTSASVVASAAIVNDTRFEIVASSKAFYGSRAQSQTTAATALVSVTAGFNLSGMGFDERSDRIITCGASRATGGNINFGYMRVSKVCQ